MASSSTSRKTVRTVTVLGSTGSIGRSTLAVIAANPDQYRVFALTCNRNIDEAARQAETFRPRYVAVGDPALARRLRSLLRAHAGVTVLDGAAEITRLAAMPEADIVVSGLVGTAGLRPTLAAVRAGKTIALANKEVMVMAGQLVNRLARRHGARIIPVDSEHSAIFQCLHDTPADQVRQLVLTGSGGPFFGRRTRLDRVTPAQACAHPRWKMGKKISVDSATLMNKCLEIIEARWLFDMPPEKISLVIHPESIVHSLVEFIDGSMLAQLGLPDMRIPIQHALTHPDRKLGVEIARLDLARAGRLTFFPVPAAMRRAVDLAFEVLRLGATYPAVLSSANETAVSLFLKEKIRFTSIVPLVEKALALHKGIPDASLEDIVALDKTVKRQVLRLCSHL